MQKSTTYSLSSVTTQYNPVLHNAFCKRERPTDRHGVQCLAMVNVRNLSMRHIDPTRQTFSKLEDGMPEDRGTSPFKKAYDDGDNGTQEETGE